jgi:predicted nucleic acid-binding protein
LDDPAVINASPLIFLVGAGLTDLARLAGNPLFIPRAVAEEIERFGPTAPAAIAIKQTSWLNVVEPVQTPSIIEHWDLGAGETSVLNWAYSHPGTIAIMDDLAARHCANSLGIPVRGTLGLILIAKRRGIIAEARALLERLRASGMYLSDRVLNRALKTVGE